MIRSDKLNNIVAIDLGFLYTKAIINGRRIIMKSVVGNSKEQRFKDLDVGINTGRDDIISRIDEEEYFISDLAVNQSDTVYHSLREDRFNGFAVDALVKTSLGLGLGDGEDKSGKVVSGLPVSHYNRYKKDIEELFLGEENKNHYYDVSDSDISYSGNILLLEGKFIPQPFGALVSKLLDSDGDVTDLSIAKQRIAVIDPGFGTTDVYVADSLASVEKMTFSTPVAMNRAYGLISDKIEEKFSVTLPLYRLESIVHTKEFKKNGKTYDMTSIINWAFQMTSNEILSVIENKWKNDLHTVDLILLAGGGGSALAQYLLPEFSNIELLEDSQWSVVEGYYRWAVRQYGR